MFSKVLSLDWLSCPQIWNIEQEKHREKEKEGGRPAKLNEKKGDIDLEREIKNKGDIFCWKNNMKFCNGGDKMRNASGHQCKVKMSGEKKSERQNLRHSLYIKRVTKMFLPSFWKFHVVVVQNNGKEMYKKSVLHVQSCFFAN